jgi:solute carrier family 6 (neurotransmitter transporter, glycine) member 5/9
VIDLMDTFGGGTGVFLVAIFEMLGIMWVYGVRNVARDFQFMLGFQPSWYWKICWALSPFLLSVIDGYNRS